MHTYRVHRLVLLVAATASALAAQSGWIKSGRNPEDYDMGSDNRVAYTGKSSGYIRSNKADPKSFGTYMQVIDAGEYRGKRLRLSAWVKAENIENWAGVWMRVDRDQRSTAFDNMQDRPIKGTQPWSRHEIVLDVDAKATQIAFGILLSGRGAAWMDDVAFEVVDERVPVTDMHSSIKSPRNLNFEAEEKK
jgi:hypothetical protein